jgi:hypothetical protein
METLPSGPTPNDDMCRGCLREPSCPFVYTAEAEVGPLVCAGHWLVFSMLVAITLAIRLYSIGISSSC